MKITLDCEILNTKKALLESFVEILEEMYSPNFDAFIDALSTFDGALELEFENFYKYEDPQDLAEVLDIVVQENPAVTILKKQ